MARHCASRVNGMERQIRDAVATLGDALDPKFTLTSRGSTTIQRMNYAIYLGHLRTTAFSVRSLFYLGVTVISLSSNIGHSKPSLPEGMYRVDWNRHVSELCVDHFTNEDFGAKDWQGVLAAQGPICSLHDVRETKTELSWLGKCNQPWVGRVIEVEHRIKAKMHRDGSFDISTELSGGLQASIPIRGTPIKGANGKPKPCEPGAKMFRPWN